MTYEQAESSPFNPFDLTKVPRPTPLTHTVTRTHSPSFYKFSLMDLTHYLSLETTSFSPPLNSHSPVPLPYMLCAQVWPHSAYPLHEIGRMVLDRNPKNYFAEIEQLAFAPSHMVPGTSQTTLYASTLCGD